MTREEAVKILKSILAYNSDFAKAKQMAIEALEQEPKQGEWLDAREEDPCWYICSECKRMVDDDSNYCPNCGARMESDEQ